ncbi:MAG TPA: DOPA 4,5-dioxygenase family protein [Candidatus Binataceae bacterium]|nr:DOPA 4,5-dioxygenase family protein [Candidatus Binataceae bacterium]
MKKSSDPAKIRFYHAHIYYDAASRATAARLRRQIARRFNVVMGRWRDEPVGPHPQPMYQVKFDPPEFPLIVPWLMLNRSGLTVLVHPDTGDAITDHAVNPLWLGQKLELNVEILRHITSA